MHAKSLDFVIYDSDGWTWKSHQVIHPTWDQIENAIRRLDKCCYPFLHLWPTSDTTEHEMIEDREWFDVIGGNGDYWIAASIDGFFQRRVVNPKGGDEEIELWTSDQGFADEGRFVCHDLNSVLRIARFYAENGQFDPKATWESLPHI